MITWYDVMEVSENATEAEIKAAYRRLAKATHPDLTNDDKTKEALFKRVQAAYAVIGDAAQRAAYDAQLLMMRTASRRTQREAPEAQQPSTPIAVVPSKSPDVVPIFVGAAVGLGLGVLFTSLIQQNREGNDDY